MSLFYLDFHDENLGNRSSIAWLMRWTEREKMYFHLTIMPIYLIRKLYCKNFCDWTKFSLKILVFTQICPFLGVANPLKEGVIFLTNSLLSLLKKTTKQQKPNYQPDQVNILSLVILRWQSLKYATQILSCYGPMVSSVLKFIGLKMFLPSYKGKSSGFVITLCNRKPFAFKIIKQ